MGRDKALIDVGGEPMAVRMAGVLRAAGCAPVVAVGGDAAGLRAVGLAWLADDMPGDGPVGGVLTALTHLDADRAVVVACDLPGLSSAVVGALVGVLDEQADVVMAETDRLEPLCAVWRRRCASHLAARLAEGVRAVHEAIDDLHVVRVSVDAHSLWNVNTPDDLRRANDLLR